jgi:5-methylcytosine-specific restriction endonuclease McrA
VSTPRRTQPMPRGWRRIRARILDRDAHTCYVCGLFATEVDHVVPVASGGTDDELNLRAICTTCHRRKTARDAHRNRPHSPRWPEGDAHPGTVGGAPRRGERKHGWRSGSEPASGG